MAHNFNRPGGGFHLWRWDGRRWNLAETVSDRLTAGMQAMMRTIQGIRTVRARIGSKIDLYIRCHPTVEFPRRKV